MQQTQTVEEFSNSESTNRHNGLKANGTGDLNEDLRPRIQQKPQQSHQEQLDDNNSEHNQSSTSTTSNSNSRRVKIGRWTFQFTWADLKWKYVIGFTIFHIVALYGFLTFPYLQRKRTFLWAVICTIVSGFGVGAGSHRLWAHRAYKARAPLRIILIICNAMAGMTSAFHWARGHRVHHKFADTDADPHNSKRGLFFSHIGWIMVREHPEVTKRSLEMDMSDCEADSICMWGLKYNKPLTLLFCFILPPIVPVYFWGEDWYYAIISQIFMRYSWVLNASWCVNSFAHAWGNRPYNKSIFPTELDVVSWATCGEGWHNYHHTFPWDYKAAEIGHLSVTTALIEMFAKIGWAYDLRQPHVDSIKSTCVKKGDGSHAKYVSCN